MSSYFMIRSQLKILKIEQLFRLNMKENLIVIDIRIRTVLRNRMFVPSIPQQQSLLLNISSRLPKGHACL